MDKDLFRLALALADCGDAAKAGESLGGVGRRTVQARIAQLERQVGARLFEAEGRRVRPTPAGEAFIGEARLSLAAGARAERLAREVAARPSGFAVGFVADALFGPLDGLAEDARLVEAGLRPVFQEMRGPEQLEALADGRLVMGFLTPPYAAPPRVETIIVHRSKWAVALPVAQAHLRRSATLATIARKRLVMIARDRAPLVHDGLIAALAGTGETPEIVQTAQQWPSVLGLVALGAGAALVPASIAERVRVEGVTLLPITDQSKLAAWPTALAYLPQPPDSRARQAVDIVKAYFRDRERPSSSHQRA